MPYTPAGVDWTVIPNWHAKYPDRHPRWISTDANRFRGHLTDFGKGAYVPFGEGMTLDELKSEVEQLGLPSAYINTNLCRIVVGQNMLAWLPLDEFRRRRREAIDDMQDRLNASLDAYLDSQRSKGVRPFKMEVEEYTDRKAVATRESNSRVGYSGKARA